MKKKDYLDEMNVIVEKEPLKILEKEDKLQKE
jgi:hypothetical protein